MATATGESLLRQVKLGMDLQTDFYDAKLTGLIDGALGDLRQSGVTVLEAEDPLLATVCALYCRGSWTGTDPDGEGKYLELYRLRKRAMMLSADYSPEVTP